MALQAYADAKSGAMQVYKAPELTIEEIERRQKEAEELEEKLRIIDERVPHVPQNLQGTTAGAGSSTFHKYRLARRREQERVEQMEKDWEEKQKQDEYERRKKELHEMDEQRTAKRRAKRQKRKAKKKSKGADGGAGDEQESGSEDDTPAALSTAAAELD